MPTDGVLQAVIEVLREIQQVSGRKEVEITGSTCPIGDLPDFDSLNGVEASGEIASKLGVELPGVNFLLNEEGTRALRVSEVADKIRAISKKGS